MNLFISDVHLAAERPEATAAFLAFLEGPARKAESLWILGDLFDQWLGDDDDRPPHLDIEAGLAALVRAGIGVNAMHGNHDFLLGSDFAERTGCRLLTEPFIADIAAEPVVLLHGDSLCTRDIEYQAFRRYTRDVDNQRRFLSLPMETRIREAQGLRSASTSRSRLKPEDIMDVTPEEVVRTLAQHESTLMIHGHTHRPAIHDLNTPSGPAKRIVLGDWYEQGTVLIQDDDGYRLAPPNESDG
ncbi:UDP-2,3-diacylglucosamine diphosphatase [Thioalkalivibrio sp. HK1]|uniref:UDP-2,3-diacylglucosamine diphosphatase n=1 Tax=Thioalkalivibrio sp. HK1 TaxID=1469245 RepID=UPI000470F87F|nr:UDP-2,3-diacylglucosamine diphosphatase [Thioalkalivibrio sp. HK1]